MVSLSSAGKESTCNAGDPGSIPGLGRSPGEGATHSSILAWRITMARGAWKATVYGVAKSWTWQQVSTAYAAPLWNCKSTIFPPDRSVLSVIKRNQFRGKKLSFLHINTLHLENSSANTNTKTSFLVSINFLHTSMNELYIHHYFILLENIYWNNYMCQVSWVLET